MSLTGLNAYQQGGPVLDKLRSLWEGIRSKADDPSLGYIGASMLPGIGEATDLVEIGAGLQDRSLGRVGLGLAALMLPFVGAAGLKKIGKKAGEKLPMDEASRLKRAEDMGFDMDVYHGTASLEGIPPGGDWDYLEPRAGSMRSRQMGAAGVSTTPLSEMASDFATLFKPEYVTARQGVNSTGARVYPLKVRSKKILPFLGPEWKKLRDEVGTLPKGVDDWPLVTALARKRGWEGLQVRDEIMMFDPKNIRSRWAAFDPAKAGSRDLLAGIGGLAGTRYMSNALREDREN